VVKRFNFGKPVAAADAAAGKLPFLFIINNNHRWKENRRSHRKVEQKKTSY
jgi:hypothetical protein